MKREKWIYQQKNSKNHIKVLYIKSVIFVKKNLKDAKYRKIRDHWHYTGKYIGDAYSIFNIKYSVSKSISIVFIMYHYHFIIKELAIELKKNLFRRKYWEKQNIYTSHRKGSYKNW